MPVTLVVADILELLPEHIVTGLAVAVITGNGFTVAVAEAVPVCPDGAVPVTVYIVVTAGDTTKGFVVEPVFHKYVVPAIELLAVIVALPPAHIV